MLNFSYQSLVVHFDCGTAFLSPIYLLLLYYLKSECPSLDYSKYDFQTMQDSNAMNPASQPPLILNLECRLIFRLTDFMQSNLHSLIYLSNVTEVISPIYFLLKTYFRISIFFLGVLILYFHQAHVYLICCKKMFNIAQNSLPNFNVFSSFIAFLYSSIFS